MEMIEIKNLTKKYGDKTVYENFNLKITENKTTVLLGESGSGKTTLLNVLAGLTDYEGEVKGNIKPVSMVFQKDALIPNLTVEQNLKLVNKSADVDKILKAVGLENAKNLYPKALSGGMARRVSIARSFIYRAPLWLMDEPFINLDLKNKFMLINYVKEKQKESKNTLIVVTHDIKEAVMLADRIIVLKKRKIIKDVKKITENTENELFDLLSGKTE